MKWLISCRTLINSNINIKTEFCICIKCSTNRTPNCWHCYHLKSWNSQMNPHYGGIIRQSSLSLTNILCSGNLLGRWKTCIYHTNVKIISFYFLLPSSQGFLFKKTTEKNPFCGIHISMEPACCSFESNTSYVFNSSDRKAAH